MGRCEPTALAPLCAAFALFTAHLLLHPQGAVRADGGKFPSDPLAKSPAQPNDVSPAQHSNMSPAQPNNMSPDKPSNMSPDKPSNMSPDKPSNMSPDKPSGNSPGDPPPKASHPPADLASKTPLGGNDADAQDPGGERGKGPSGGPARGGAEPLPRPRVQPGGPAEAARKSDRPNTFLNGPEMCSTDVLIDNFLKCLTCEKKKDVREGFAACTKQSPDPKGVEAVLDQCEAHIFTAHETPPERLLILCIDDHERTNLTTCLTGNMNRISAEPRHRLKPVTLFMRCAMSVRMQYCDK